MSSSGNNNKNGETDQKQLIIGAGFVGLGMAQALKEAGILYDQVDASNDIGGNWYHGVYETAHIISSRKVTQFTILFRVFATSSNLYFIRYLIRRGEVYAT